MPFFNMSFDSGKYVLHPSIEAKLLTTLSKMFNFTFEMIYAHQDWGKFENNSWTGTIGFVWNKV